VIRPDAKTRYAAVVLLLALLACAAVALFRIRAESDARRVEIAMDYTDFVQMARSYNYNPASFLIALRRAGLTSLALTEELGANIGDNGRAYATTGAALLNQARLSPLSDPILESLVRSNRIVRNAVYVMISDEPTYAQLRSQFALHFEPKTIRVLRASKPYLIEVRTQIDYFNATGFGIPPDQLALAKRLGLLVVPRFQNDERFDRAQIAAELDGVVRSGARVSTVIFFGLGNEVMGYPDHLDDTAAVFKAHGSHSAHPFNFGTIETYDESQVQKGSVTLARDIPEQTVRVQAIAKTELDKIKIDDVIARYVLGVRERNIRVVYMRPWLHQDGTLSIEATNVEIVKAIADELKSHGMRLGRATPIPANHGDNRILVGIATLAVPSIFVLLLGVFGWYRPSYAIAAYALTLILYGAGVVSHHDIFVRSLIALAAALLFATAAILAIAGATKEDPAAKYGDQFVRSLGWTLAVTAIALLGALAVVGILSSPLTMDEIERFRGVKLVLALPPLIALVLYLFDRRFNSGIEKPGEVFTAPIRLYQLLIGIVIIAGGVLLLMRSGNQSDIAPSPLEVALRHYLTHVLSVRPRTKEFLIGYPAMMLMPALLPLHRRLAGWLVALAIGVGAGDIIDTFSHLHTPVLISVERIFNGLVIGVIAGALFIWIYRRACIALGLLRVR
jgi:hypothetical protein